MLRNYETNWADIGQDHSAITIINTAPILAFVLLADSVSNR